MYNNGHMERDFTYIDDVIYGVIRIGSVIPKGRPDWKGDDPSISAAPYIFPPSTYKPSAHG